MKNEAQHLIDRFLSARNEGREAYFDADEIDDLLEGCEDKEDFDLYEEVLALGLKLHPENIGLQTKRCWQYVVEENYTTALELIEQIGATGDQEIEAVQLECYLMLDMTDEAEALSEKMIAEGRESMDLVFEYIVPLLNDKEMYSLALEYVNRGLELYPDSLVLKEELCFLMEVAEDLEGAIDLCNAMIDEDPYSYEYWFTLGRLYSLTEEFEKAIDAFDFAQTCEEPDSELKLLKAYCFFMSDKYEEALKLYTELLKDEEKNGEDGEGDDYILERVRPLLAECYMKLFDYEAAYLILHELIADDAEAAGYETDNADTEVNGADTEADDTDTDSTDAARKDYSPYIYYMHCCAQTDRKQDALNALETAATVFDGSAHVLSLMAYAYMESAENDDNLDVINKLFELIDDPGDDLEEEADGDNPSGKDGFSETIGKMLEYFKKIYAANPDQPYINLYLATAYLINDDMQNFEKHYNLLSAEELDSYAKKYNAGDSRALRTIAEKHIGLRDLAEEYLSKPENSN
ncbi:Cytochrome c biogenesis factor [Bacteroidales bacterium Barb7]|nr:Cytochrome c biogenesis factor [Bacteroidales bacterium Barb7]